MITIYGQHTCQAAIENPDRFVQTVFLLKGSEAPFNIPKNIKIEFKDKAFFDKLSIDGATQNIAAMVEPLTNGHIETLKDLQTATILVLDQVTDPRNVGAIFRNAAAFGVSAVIMHDRNAPKENAVMLKTACGGFDHVKSFYVTNISQTIDTLKAWGYWAYGLAEGGKQKLHNITWPPKRVIVMGAEGSGIRPLVKKNCDEIITIATKADFSTLNVVNATAIVLYELFEN